MFWLLLPILDMAVVSIPMVLCFPFASSFSSFICKLLTLMRHLTAKVTFLAGFRQMMLQHTQIRLSFLGHAGHFAFPPTPYFEKICPKVLHCHADPQNPCPPTHNVLSDRVLITANLFVMKMCLIYTELLTLLPFAKTISEKPEQKCRLGA